MILICLYPQLASNGELLQSNEKDFHPLMDRVHLIIGDS